MFVQTRWIVRTKCSCVMLEAFAKLSTSTSQLQGLSSTQKPTWLLSMTLCRKLVTSLWWCKISKANQGCFMTCCLTIQGKKEKPWSLISLLASPMEIINRSWRPTWRSKTCPAMTTSTKPMNSTLMLLPTSCMVTWMMPTCSIIRQSTLITCRWVIGEISYRSTACFVVSALVNTDLLMDWWSNVLFWSYFLL